MKKPLIGVTPSLDQETKDSTCRPTYLAAIRHAGGIPVILPLKAETEDLKQLVETLDGFLFTGGPDIHPFYFGEETHEKCGNVSPERDQMELSFLPLVMAAKKPVLGICRGIQILNVYFGGTLTQDIPTQLGGDHSKGVCHPVTIKKDSILGNLYGESMEVNSYHHQALDKLGEGLQAIAWGESNGHTFTEAVQHETLPIWSVQWHPERMTGPVTNPKECADSLPMFEYFVKQCTK